MVKLGDNYHFSVTELPSFDLNAAPASFSIRQSSTKGTYFSRTVLQSVINNPDLLLRVSGNYHSHEIIVQKDPDSPVVLYQGNQSLPALTAPQDLSCFVFAIIPIAGGEGSPDNK